MSNSVKILGGAAALLAAAAIGGSLISVALAGGNDSSNDADVTDVEAYCQTFLDSFASHLGVSTDELAPAAEAAAIDAVNAAVAGGDLTQDKADAIIERINNADDNGCGWIGLHLAAGKAHGHARVGFLNDALTAAATALGMEQGELRHALADKSLEEIAGDQNVSYDTVKGAVLDAVQTDLDAAVADGNLPQDRADSIQTQIETWLNDGGKLPDSTMFHPFAKLRLMHGVLFFPGHANH